MAHFIKKYFFLLATLLSVAWACQCNNAGNSNQEPISSSQGSVSVLLGFSDTLLYTLPILPDDYFTKEHNILTVEGLEIEPERIKEILKLDVGFVFPKGIIVDLKQLDTEFFPESIFYLIGKWTICDCVDALFIKHVFKEGGDSTIYVLTVKAGHIIDSRLIAFASNKYDFEVIDNDWNDCDLFGPWFAVRTSCNTYRVTIPESKTVENKNQRTFIISPEGVITIH